MLRTPSADEVVSIYETRKNRATGSHTEVLDLRPIKTVAKYALVCLTHKQAALRDVRLAAEAESHRSGEWCTECDGEHVPPAAPRKFEFTRDVLRATYMHVVKNWAVTTEEIAKEMFGNDVPEARAALDRLGDLVAGTHVNGETPLTWQSMFDVENETNVPQRAGKAFNKVFPKNAA